MSTNLDITCVGKTLTTEGWIEHKTHTQEFPMPVVLKIDNSMVRYVKTPQAPLRVNGKLAYALPGGHIYIEA